MHALDFWLPYLFRSNFCVPCPVAVILAPPPPVEGAFEYVLTVERYDPITQSAVRYREIAGLQISDFPYSLQDLPVGYYRTVINAVTLSGLRTVFSPLLRAGSPCKYILNSVQLLKSCQSQPFTLNFWAILLDVNQRYIYIVTSQARINRICWCHHHTILILSIILFFVLLIFLPKTPKRKTFNFTSTSFFYMGKFSDQ